MKKVFRKLKLRSKQFVKHPVAKDNMIKALFRYVTFNLINQVKSNIKYEWISPLVFYANKGDAGIVGNIYCGLIEFDESMFVLHYLREQDTFLDIGANVGHYSLLASGIKGCQTISIEPVPETFKKLNRHVQQNKLLDKISTLNIGVGNMTSELNFSTDKDTMNRIVDNDYKNSVKVLVETVDNLKIQKDISLIKMDVEGYEKFALEGSSETLKNQNVKAIIIEINFSNKFYGIENEEVSDILINHGFSPYKYNPMNRELVELKLYNKNQYNTIFVRDYKYVIARLKGSKGIDIWNKTI